MLVNDREEIRYQAVPPQWLALRMQIKQSHVVETVFVSLNLLISGREEDVFFVWLRKQKIRITLHW